ncbi:MAG: hypothetical protein IJB79_03520 [Candidatus Gastranaerophilales bacterium]|nr:hypothetical protein [Candidatus Gastranaerophilales bacterium]
MCTPNAVMSAMPVNIFSNISKGVGMLASGLDTVSQFQTNKANNKYRTQVALNNAKIAQQEALRQNQLGIEKSRLDKITSMQELNKIKAKNSASNLDMMSLTNELSYIDSKNFTDASSQLIKNEYSAKANSYYRNANQYLAQASEYQKQYNQSLFDYSLNALGRFNQVAFDWYENGEGK